MECRQSAGESTVFEVSSSTDPIFELPDGTTDSLGGTLQLCRMFI